MALIRCRARDGIGADAGAGLAGVGLRAGAAIGARGAVCFCWGRAGARRRLARAGLVALVLRGARDWIGADASAGLTGVGLRAGVSVGARGAVRGGRMRARAGGACVDGAGVAVVARAAGSARGEAVLIGHLRVEVDEDVASEESAGGVRSMPRLHRAVGGEHEGPNHRVIPQRDRFGGFAESAGAPVLSAYFNAQARGRQPVNGLEPRAIARGDAARDTNLRPRERPELRVISQREGREIVRAAAQLERALNGHGAVRTGGLRLRLAVRHRDRGGSRRRRGDRWQCRHRRHRVPMREDAELVRQRRGLHVADGRAIFQEHAIGEDVVRELDA